MSCLYFNCGFNCEKVIIVDGIRTMLIPQTVDGICTMLIPQTANIYSSDWCTCTSHVNLLILLWMYTYILVFVIAFTIVVCSFIFLNHLQHKSFSTSHSKLKALKRGPPRTSRRDLSNFAKLDVKLLALLKCGPPSLLSSCSF